MTTNGSQIGPGYDYATALTNLREKIQELSTVQQQYKGQPTKISSGLQYWRHNKSNIFVVFMMYAMSTASVIAAVMAESRLQSDKLLDQHEQRQLRQSITRLQQQVQHQQQLIDGLRDTVQQYKPSWWKGTGDIQQQLLQQVQAWRNADDLQVVTASSASAGSEVSSSSSEETQASGDLGMRVGQLGRGFII